MQSTSDKYKEAVIAGTRATDARVSFGAYDVATKDLAQPYAVGGTLAFTSIQAVKGAQRQPDYKAASFEPDKVILDGSYYLMPDDVNPNQDLLGWWSQNLSDKNGEFGRTLYFNGATTAPYTVEIPDAAKLYTGDIVTLECWFNAQSFNGRVALFSTRQGNLAGCWQMEIDGLRGNRLCVSGVGTYIAEAKTVAFETGVWYHVAFTKNGSDARLYINGESIALSNVTEQPLLNPSYVLAKTATVKRIGASGDFVQPFAGEIRAVRLWNYVRTQLQIKAGRDAIYDATEVGLMGNWRMDEGAGTTVTDYSANPDNGVTTALWAYLSVPGITILFSQPQTSKGLGLFFGSDEEACSQFTVTWKKGALTIASQDVMNNTSSGINVIQNVANYDQIDILFRKTVKPYRYVRMMEIAFGLEEAFDGDSLVSASIVEEVDPSGGVLSINTLKITLLNQDQKFNMLNPEGIYKQLQTRQKINAYSGLQLDTGAYEFVNMGVYYLSDWKNANGLTASLEATDVIGLLDKTTYRSSPFWQGVPVETALRHILNDAGVFQLTVNPNASGEVVWGYIPVKSHREALKDVLLATRNTLRVSRTGVMEVSKLDRTTPLTEIDNDTMLGSPTIEQKPLITAVEVPELTFTIAPTITEITSTVTSLAGKQTIILDYGKPVWEPKAYVAQKVAFNETLTYSTLPYAAYSTTINSIAGGIARFTSTGGDPMIMMNAIGSFDPNVYRYIAVRYRVIGGQTPSWEFLPLNTKYPEYSGEFYMAGALISDGGWHVSYIDCWAHPEWKKSGNITGWRWDWCTTKNVTMEFDYIMLVDSLSTVNKISTTSAEIEVIGSGLPIKVWVEGKELVESVRTITSSIAVQSGDVPQTAVVSDNKLIYNGKAVADYLLEYYQRRVKQTFSYFDNPAIQAGDYVEVETMFGASYKGIVEKQEITFAPDLTGRLEVTG